jgi:hypothetical protein
MHTICDVLAIIFAEKFVQVSFGFAIKQNEPVTQPVGLGVGTRIPRKTSGIAFFSDCSNFSLA